MVLASLTERVSVLTGCGDRGLGGVEAVREGQSHPRLLPLHSYFPSVCPPNTPWCS